MKLSKSIAGSSGNTVRSALGPIEPKLRVKSLSVSLAVAGDAAVFVDAFFAGTPDATSGDSLFGGEIQFGSIDAGGKDLVGELAIQEEAPAGKPYLVISLRDGGSTGDPVGVFGAQTSTSRMHGTESIRSRDAKFEPRPIGEPVPII